MKTEVKVYIMSDCPYCKKLLLHLNELEIDHSIVNVDTKEGDNEFKKIMEIAHSDYLPIIKVGEKLLVPNISFKTIDESVKLISKLIL